MHMCGKVHAATHANIDTLEKKYLGREPMATMVLTMLHWHFCVVQMINID